MAKKSRRARRQRAARLTTTPPPTTGAQAPQSPAAPADDHAAAAPILRKQVDFRTEYRYVINDLRSMAIIAVAMLAVLIALSLVIR